MWALEWTGTLDERRAYRMPRNAETATLRNDGERLAVTCPPEQEPLKERLGRWPESEVTRTGDCYLLQLIVTAKDGFVHDDCDSRTPPHRITCPSKGRGRAETRTARISDVEFVRASVRWEFLP